MGIIPFGTKLHFTTIRMIQRSFIFCCFQIVHKDCVLFKTENEFVYRELAQNRHGELAFENKCQK